MLTTADLLALHAVPGVGRATVHRALTVCARAELPLPSLLGASMARLLALLPPGCAREAEALHGCTAAHRAAARQDLAAVRQRGAQAIPFWAPAYPSRLRLALGPHAPPILFCTGPAALLSRPCGGIVGGRRPSAQGRHLARACALGLAPLGAAIVSGGAQGIDREAHAAALAASAPTIAVLPQGLLAPGPPAWLLAAARSGAALLVSEVPPFTPWQTHAAVVRNATVSALARVLCVLDARKRGGSIQTARHALSQGKPVLYGGGPSSSALWARHTQTIRLRSGPAPEVASQVASAWQSAERVSLPRQSQLELHEACA